MMKWPHYLFGLSSLALPLATGCGGPDPNLGQVQGVVTFDGQPLADATVILVQGQGRPAAGVTDAEGRYQVALTGARLGTAPGVNKVRIITERGPSETPDGTPIPPAPERLPSRYHAQTELAVEVKAGELTEANFELTSANQAKGKSRNNVR
jgi:hypothetical protein